MTFSHCNSRSKSTPRLPMASARSSASSPWKPLPRNYQSPDWTEWAQAWYLAILGCQNANDQGKLLGRLCYVTAGPKSSVESLHVPPCRSGLWTGRASYDFMFTVSLDDLMRAKILMQVLSKTIYLPSYKPSTPERRAEDMTTSIFRLSLPTWVQAALRLQGYGVSDLHHATEYPSPDHSHALMLTRTSFNIQIHYRHVLIGEIPHAVAIEARIWILSSSNSDENRNTPAYASAIWVTVLPWVMSFPFRLTHLVAPTGDEVTLRLGLGLAVPSHAHYHIHVEVAPDVPTVTSNSSTRTVPERLSWQLNTPHKDLKLTMLGSVRRALELHGFSVCFEGPHPLPDVTSSHSYYSLSLFDPNSGSTIFIKYFYAFDTGDVRPGRLVIVAPIILESPFVTSDVDRSEGYRDGPHVVAWHNVGIASWCLGVQQVTLNTPTGDLLTLRLGVDLAWQSEYYLFIDIGDNGSATALHESDHLNELDEDDYYMLHESHRILTLTLPEHVKCALQAQGYKVSFEGSCEQHLNPCHLTLDLSDALFAIDIKYSHHISTGADGKQRLTFRACVRDVSSRTRDGVVGADAGPAIQDDSLIIDWDAWQPETRYDWGTVREREGWRWDLPEKDVKLTDPTGLEIILRLGFHLVWLGEYCLTVEVNPPSPLSRSESPETPETSDPNVDDDEDSGDSDDEGMQRMAIGEDDNHVRAHPAVVELEI